MVSAAAWVDFSIFQSEITHYSARCEIPVINGHCTRPEYTYRPTTYRVDVEHQTVIYWMEGFNVQRLQDCAVADRMNWTCKFSDGSAELGFQDGKHFERTIGQTSSIVQDFDTYAFDLSKYGYSMWEWLDMMPNR